mmetsp:Transcript_39216/g.37632  ORF Transcript_39216/g.37632 Transcript_39216/m.37632 type:complete len:91 (-) Transcript_39216:733-1005(-)
MNIFEPIDAAIEDLAAKIHTPFDQTKVIVIMFGSIPVNMLLYYVKNPTLKHLYSILIGTFMQCFIVRENIIHLQILCFFSYFLMRTIEKT